MKKELLLLQKISAVILIVFVVVSLIYDVVKSVQFNGLNIILFASLINVLIILVLIVLNRKKLNRFIVFPILGYVLASITRFAYIIYILSNFQATLTTNFFVFIFSELAVISLLIFVIYLKYRPVKNFSRLRQFVLIASLSLTSLMILLTLPSGIGIVIYEIPMIGFLPVLALSLYNEDYVSQKSFTSHQDRTLMTLQARGPLPIGKAIGLSILTFGIYFFIWIYRINETMATLTKDNSSPGKSLAAFIFIPFYPIFWAYNKSKQFSNYNVENMRRNEDKSTIYVLLSLFGLIIVVTAIIQIEINEIIAELDRDNLPKQSVESVAATNHSHFSNRKGSSTDNAQLLKELSELYQMGILTDAEYEEKKQDILKRM